MIAIGTNLLVYAYRPDMEFHARAAALVRGCAEGSAPWAIPWPCVHEFYAVVTNGKIFREPSPPAAAIGQINAWMASPGVILLGERAGYWAVAEGMLAGGLIRGGQVHDARIAALCRFHGVGELWSADRDYQRFGGLKVRNPLVG